VEAYTDMVDLEAGKEYDFVLETENSTPGALRCELSGRHRKSLQKKKELKKESKPEKYILPANTEWLDFWSGNQFTGGQTVTSNAQIDRIPIFVKAGSIIPMGTFEQYATEKAVDSLEVRVYPGANGSFLLYEDENDNYNYEKGISATIPFRWIEAKHQTYYRETGWFIPRNASKTCI